MTWSLSASGHHSSEDWQEEERELLARIVDAIDGADAAVCSGFSFAGNHISASSIEDAKAKLEAAEGEAS